MNEIGVKKCPSCGGEMEQGFIHAPRGIYWDNEEHKLHIFTSETLISQWSWTCPRTQGWRCAKCRLVILLY
jgi:hypothetical protein